MLARKSPVLSNLCCSLSNTHTRTHSRIKVAHAVIHFLCKNEVRVLFSSMPSLISSHQCYSHLRDLWVGFSLRPHQHTHTHTHIHTSLPLRNTAPCSPSLRVKVTDIQGDSTASGSFTHSRGLAWRIPGTGEAWWAAVAQSRTGLKRLSSSSSSSGSFWSKWFNVHICDLWRKQMPKGEA